MRGDAAKGQLISKGNFSVFKSTKKPTKYFLMISALASKMSQKNANYYSNANKGVSNIMKCLYFFEFIHLGQKSLNKFRCLFGRFEDTKIPI